MYIVLKNEFDELKVFKFLTFGILTKTHYVNRITCKTRRLKRKTNPICFKKFGVS